MDHVCTHVPHLDLVNIDQNMSAIARLIVTCDPVKTFKSVDITAAKFVHSRKCASFLIRDFFFHFDITYP